MCIMCVEVIKEKMTPAEFWRNYQEITIPEDHKEEVIKAVASTSLEYQEALAKGLLQNA